MTSRVPEQARGVRRARGEARVEAGAFPSTARRRRPGGCRQRKHESDAAGAGAKVSLARLPMIASLKAPAGTGMEPCRNTRPASGTEAGLSALQVTWPRFWSLHASCGAALRLVAADNLEPARE